ncbi:MAG: hypothetical protein AAF921_23845, partial [Cyanobacteria bacterium P01_D01_bin.44]
MIKPSGLWALLHLARSRYRGHSILSRLLSIPRTRLLLGLTLILVLLHSIDDFMWTTLPVRLLAVAMLVLPRGIRSRWAWLGLATLLGGHTV